MYNHWLTKKDESQFYWVGFGPVSNTTIELHSDYKNAGNAKLPGLLATEYHFKMIVKSKDMLGEKLDFIKFVQNRIYNPDNTGDIRIETKQGTGVCTDVTINSYNLGRYKLTVKGTFEDLKYITT